MPIFHRDRKLLDNVGNYIRQLRRDRRVTQEELGNAIGASAKRIQELETANATLSALELKLLSEFFGVIHDKFLVAKHVTAPEELSEIERLREECRSVLPHVTDATGLKLVADALSKLVP